MRFVYRMLCLAGLAVALPVPAQFDDIARLPADGQPVARAYATVDGLQLHYRTAGPGAKQEDYPPVIALHQSPNSGQVFLEFMAVLAQDRRVIAPDTPGFGQSDRPRTRPAVVDYAAWMDEFTDQLGLGTVDVIGYHTGASIAVEWALRHPERVRRLWLVGLPAFTEEEREELLARPWPDPSPLSAERVVAEWRGSVTWQGPGQSDVSLERTYLAKLGAGRYGWWGPAAVFGHAFLERLALVTQPVRIARPRDDLWEITDRVRAALPQLEVTDVPDRGFAVFEVEPERMAALARLAFDEPLPR